MQDATAYIGRGGRLDTTLELPVKLNADLADRGFKDEPSSWDQISEVCARANVGTYERLWNGNQAFCDQRPEQVVGSSRALEAVLEQAEMVAPTDSTVLIQGETGTGKELIARAIHNLSSRRGGPFVKLNCAAIPLDLLESELFGHERGAFTGATAQRIGRFELADKGTLFLDEVGDIPAALQPKLLRVLQEQEFERLGSSKTKKVDARLVAATNRDLSVMVNLGQFRIDLYYRLNVFPVLLPPLRERREDIPALVRHYVDKYARKMNRHIETIPLHAMEALANYPWPGNVRELQNFIERTVILSPGSILQPPLAELKHATVQTPSSKLSTLKEVEREHVLRAIRESNWVIGGPNGAAARLGIKRTTLMYRIQRLGIQVVRRDVSDGQEKPMGIESSLIRHGAS
jgi:formate hydrogenlyase transcriptional activator